MYQTDPDLERKMRLAQAMMTRPQGETRHWTQGLNQALSPMLGAMMSNKFAKQDQQNRSDYNQSLQSALNSNNLDEYITTLGSNENTVSLANDLKQRQMLNAMSSKSGSNIGSYNPRDYTTTSFAKFLQSGDPSVLNRYEPRKSVTIGSVPHVFDSVGGGYVPARVDNKPVTPETVGESEGTIAGAIADAKGKVQEDLEGDKKSTKADAMIGYVSEARELLKDAGGGTYDAFEAKGKRFLGVSDKETQANTQLELISGWMVSNVPRMEGPQSDFDVKNYRTMAAQVGDVLLPVEDRLAALDVLERLQKKYAKGDSSDDGAPDGVDPAVWNVMTPEEKKLFQ